jgi:hypothetical protein
MNDEHAKKAIQDFSKENEKFKISCCDFGTHVYIIAGFRSEDQAKIMYQETYEESMEALRHGLRQLALKEGYFDDSGGFYFCEVCKKQGGCTRAQYSFCPDRCMAGDLTHCTLKDSPYCLERCNRCH